MYRLQQNESRLMESGYHEEIPFFREAIALIDECTKLMKEDRILLRNKIKDYLKDLRENKQIESEWENEQIQMLIQIFVETNKKKSLSKIQRGDKVMDWMQIKLRKFIDNNKREKHKKEVESFRKAKFINVKKPVQYCRGEKNSSLSKEPVPFQAKVNEGNIPSTQFGLKRFMAANVQSLSKSREKSPSESRKINPHNQSYSQYSYRKNFPFLRKNKQNEGPEAIKSIKATLDIKSTSKQPVKRATSAKSHSLNKSFEHFNNIKKAWNNSKVNVTHIEKGVKEKPAKQDFYHERPNSSNNTANDINKLTQLFTQQLNQEAKRKSPDIVFSNSQSQADKSINQSILWPKSFIPTESANATDREKEVMNNSVSRYEASSKKIQQMLEHSKNMLSHFGAKHEDISNSIPTVSLSSYSQNLNEEKMKKEINPQPAEDLFTPPEFLAQCRKFLFSSSKKPQQQIEDSRQIDDSRDSSKKLTFTNIISESKEKSIEKYQKLSHLGINEVFSENASANISTKKPSSEVHFQFKNISVRNVEELLLEIFREGYRVTMDCYQIGQIMSKSESDCERLLQQYCDFLNSNPVNDNNRLTFDFISTVKQFYTYGKVLNDSQDYFCNFLSSILDIKKRGFVNIEDIDCFLQSLESSEIESSAMEQIHRSLEEVFRKCCQIEGGGSSMTRWSLYYLQLTQDEDFELLHEHLSKFEFQFDQE